MTTIMAKFMWKECRPDNREFRQNSSLLEPLNFTFGVEIPVTAEYVLNADEILKVREVKATSELGYDARLPIHDEPQPIYTPKALQFCLDKLGEYLRDPESKDFQAETSDDWGDTSTEPTTTEIENGWSDDADWSSDSKAETKSATEGDGWSDAIDTDDKHKNEEKWEAESEDWS